MVRPGAAWIRPNPPPPQQLTLLGVALPIRTADIEGSPGGRWQSGFQWAPHGQGPAWMHDFCDTTTLDLPALPTPTGITATPSTTGGTLAAGTYTYQVVAVDANGSTLPSSAVTATTTGTTGSVRVAWPANVAGGSVEEPESTARHITLSVYGRVGGSVGLLASGLDPRSGGYTDTGSGTPGAVVPSSNTTGGPGVYVNPAIRQHFPGFVQVLDQCTAAQWASRDFVGRARLLLENATPKAVAQEFWRGTFAAAHSYPNDFLANPATCIDVTPASVPSVARGLEVLEDALAGSGFGGQGMIHCKPGAVGSFLTARRVGTGPGSQVLTLNDTLIVPDAGYDGSGPAGFPAITAAQNYMYATDYVSAIVDGSPEVFPESVAEATDRPTNLVTFRAQWAATAVWDGLRHFCTRVALDQ